MTGLRIGIHTSREGSLTNAALRAHQTGANTFQIFSSSPRMWRTIPLNADDILSFKNEQRRFDLYPLAIHSSYLINLASLDPVIRARSVAAFRGELERAVAIGADYVVTHPGSFRGSPRDEAMAAFALGVRDAAQELTLGKLQVLLENTAGAGAQLGGSFADLRAIRDLTAQLCTVPVGYCLDTCHLYVSGFDIATSSGLDETIAAADRILGTDHVKLIHCNDSKGALGSRLDRHANIGRGTIGLDAFERILNHPALRQKPFILETPDNRKGDQRRDIRTLKRLAGLKPVATKRGLKEKAKNAG